MSETTFKNKMTIFHKGVKIATCSKFTLKFNKNKTRCGKGFTQGEEEWSVYIPTLTFFKTIDVIFNKQSSFCFVIEHPYLILHGEMYFNIGETTQINDFELFNCTFLGIGAISFTKNAKK